MIFLFFNFIFSFNKNLLSETLPSGSNISEIKNIIDNFASKHIMIDTPGAVIAVLKDGNVIFNSSYGKFDIENNIDVTQETIFDWASITKTLTYISLAQLKEKGLINYEDDIKSDKYFGKNFFKRINHDQPIRILDLMHHKSGWEEVIFGLAQKGVDNIPPLEQALKDCEPNQYYKPNEHKGYSNYGSSVAGRIIEIISGKKYHEYIKENIFNKLGMNHSTVLPTHFDNNWVKSNYHVSGYSSGSKGKFVHSGRSHDTFVLTPAGALVSTLKDMIKYAAALTPTNPVPCPLFDNPNTLLEFYNVTDIVNDYGTASAHGMFSTIYGGNQRSREHAGNTYSHSSELKILPSSGFAVVISTNLNSESAFTSKLIGEIFGFPNIPEITTGLPDINIFKSYYTLTQRVINGFLSIAMSWAFTFPLEIINNTHIRFLDGVYKQQQPYLFINTDNEMSKKDIIVFAKKSNNEVFISNLLSSDLVQTSTFIYLWYLLSLIFLIIFAIFYIISFLIFLYLEITNYGIKSIYKCAFSFSNSYLIRIIVSCEFIKYFFMILIGFGAASFWSPSRADFYFLLIQITMTFEYSIGIINLVKYYLNKKNNEDSSIALHPFNDNGEKNSKEEDSKIIFKDITILIHFIIFFLANLQQIIWGLYHR